MLWPKSQNLFNSHRLVIIYRLWLYYLSTVTFFLRVLSLASPMSYDIYKHIHIDNAKFTGKFRMRFYLMPFFVFIIFPVYFFFLD